jgi:hypothetical protein
MVNECSLQSVNNENTKKLCERTLTPVNSLQQFLDRKEYGIGLVEQSLLSAIIGHGKSFKSISELARVTQKSRSWISVLVARLSEKGLISKTEHHEQKLSGEYTGRILGFEIATDMSFRRKYTPDLSPEDQKQILNDLDFEPCHIELSEDSHQYSNEKFTNINEIIPAKPVRSPASLVKEKNLEDRQKTGPTPKRAKIKRPQVSIVRRLVASSMPSCLIKRWASGFNIAMMVNTLYDTFGFELLFGYLSTFCRNCRKFPAGNYSLDEFTELIIGGIEVYRESLGVLE